MRLKRRRKPFLLHPAVAVLARVLSGRRPAPAPAPDTDCGALRARLGLSQCDFARRYRLPLGSLRKWEQQQRRPDAAARAYLMLIDRDPLGVAAALARPPALDAGLAAMLARAPRRSRKAGGARR
jgi:putative transcriptional regulator